MNGDNFTTVGRIVSAADPAFLDAAELGCKLEQMTADRDSWRRCAERLLNEKLGLQRALRLATRRVVLREHSEM